jgi:cold shock CspA family protein
MPHISFQKTFNVNLPSENLTQGDKISFRFVLDSPLINDFTASLSPGQLTISSLTPSIGYAFADCPFIETSSEDNEIILKGNINNFHDNGYIFTPNPINPSLPQSSLYPTYGNVDYPFVIKPYDLFLLYLNDGTYLEYTILELINGTGEIKLKLNQLLPQNAKTAINGNTFDNFLILTKIVDETNAYIIYNKRPGRTSYGFIIPDNLSPEVLANIDTITKEVKQKLLNEQQTVEVNSIDTIGGGDF